MAICIQGADHGDQLRHGFNAQLRNRMCPMYFDGLFCDIEVGRNLLVEFTKRNLTYHLILALRQGAEKPLKFNDLVTRSSLVSAARKGKFDGFEEILF